MDVLLCLAYGLLALKRKKSRTCDEDEKLIVLQETSFVNCL